MDLRVPPLVSTRSGTFLRCLCGNPTGRSFKTCVWEFDALNLESSTSRRVRCQSFIRKDQPYYNSLWYMAGSSLLPWKSGNSEVLNARSKWWAKSARSAWYEFRTAHTLNQGSIVAIWRQVIVEKLTINGANIFTSFCVFSRDSIVRCLKLIQDETPFWVLRLRFRSCHSQRKVGSAVVVFERCLMFIFSNTKTELTLIQDGTPGTISW